MTMEIIRKKLICTMLLFPIILTCGSWSTARIQVPHIEDHVQVTCVPEPTEIPVPTVIPKQIPIYLPIEVLRTTPRPIEPEENEQLSRYWEYDEDISSYENIYILLTQFMHWSPICACAAIANMDAETGGTFNPAIGTVSFGLIQWLGSRWSNCCSWCWNNDYSEWSIEGQCRFMEYEMQNGYYNVWESICEAGTAYDAAYLFCVYYEAPYDTYGQAYYRASLADAYYEELAGG